MPVEPWTDPKLQQAFERSFDEQLHAASDPKPSSEGYGSERSSKEEFFGPVATCDFCGSWQILNLGHPAVEHLPQEQRVAARMQALGWTKHGERDACPRHQPGSRR